VSNDDLRRLLDFPDTQLRLPPVSSIAQRAHRRRVQQRLTAVAVAAAVIAVVALMGALSHGWTQQSVPAAPSPTPHVGTGAPGPLTVSPREHVRLTNGWSVWLTRAGDFCWGQGSAATVAKQHRCRSSERVAHGSLQVLMLKIPHGALYLGMLPWLSDKVELLAGGVRHPVTDLVYFGRPENGVFYIARLPVRDPAATVTVYDVCDHPHTHPPDPALAGNVCTHPGWPT